MGGRQSRKTSPPGGVEAASSTSTSDPGPQHHPLAQHLEWWCDNINPAARKGSLKHQLHILFAGSKVGVGSMTVMLLLELSDVVAARSPFAGQDPLRWCFGLYSSTFAQLVFVRHRRVLQRSLLRLAELTRQPEFAGDPETQERMARTARSGQRLWRFYRSFATVVVTSSLLNILVEEPHYHHEVAKFLQGGESMASWVRWILMPLQAFSLLHCAVSYWTMYATLLAIYDTSVDLLRAVGRLIEAQECSLRLTALHRDIFRILLDMDGAMFGEMPHLMVLPIVTPLISLMEVMNTRTGPILSVESLSSLTVPLFLLLVFVPICLAGDSLVVALGGVSSRAYRGPWLEENAAQCHLRRCLMQSSGARATVVRGRGLGTFHRRMCIKGLQQWFKALQVLINVQRQQQEHHRAATP